MTTVYSQIGPYHSKHPCLSYNSTKRHRCPEWYGQIWGTFFTLKISRVGAWWICFLNPYYSGGDLGNLIAEQKNIGNLFDQALLLSFVHNLASGMQYMKTMKILHRDLKEFLKNISLCTIGPATITLKNIKFFGWFFKQFFSQLIFLLLLKTNWKLETLV